MGLSFLCLSEESTLSCGDFCVNESKSLPSCRRPRSLPGGRSNLWVRGRVLTVPRSPVSVVMPGQYWPACLNPSGALAGVQAPGRWNSEPKLLHRAWGVHVGSGPWWACSARSIALAKAKIHWRLNGAVFLVHRLNQKGCGKRGLGFSTGQHDCIQNRQKLTGQCLR